MCVDSENSNKYYMTMGENEVNYWDTEMAQP